MATRLQKKLARAIIQDDLSTAKKSGGELLKSVGYSEATAIGHTSEILESKGVKEELAVLGFSVKDADETVAKILKSGKEENRLKASDQIYKRLGAYEPEKKDIRKLVVSINSEMKQRADKALDMFLNGESN